jgi:ferric-dicitrate binding protein FerR (iron transport regulator)
MLMPQPDRFIDAEQLLLDERFLAWAEGLEDASATDWIESLRQTSPEQEEELLEALLTFQAIRRDESPVAGAPEQLERLLDRLERESTPVFQPSRSSKKSLIPLLSITLLAGVLAIALYLNAPTANNTITGDGKVTKLSDGTKVALSSTSTITYADGFEKKKVREVWVKGEAQFDVAHQKNDQPFIVHTRHFDIEVTGTRFIVNNQSTDASVLLQEGSVNLIFPNGERARMKPGDFFSLNAKKASVDAVTTTITPATLERHIVFDNTPFSQVAKEIERRYEVPVRILDPVLSEKLITGILPNNDLDALLKALESAMDCRITRENQTIYIKSSF